MHREEITGGADHSRFLGCGHSGFRRAKVLVGPGLHLDENERAVRIDHYQIKFTGLAAKIARKSFKSFSF